MTSYCMGPLLLEIQDPKERIRDGLTTGEEIEREKGKIFNVGLSFESG